MPWYFASCRIHLNIQCPSRRSVGKFGLYHVCFVLESTLLVVLGRLDVSLLDVLPLALSISLARIIQLE